MSRGWKERYKECPVCGHTSRDIGHFVVNRELGLGKCFRTGTIIKINEIELKDGYTINTKEDSKDFEEWQEIAKNQSEPLGFKLIQYLQTRGITSPEVLKRIRQKKGTDNTLIMGMNFLTGEISGIKYRTIDKKIWSEKGSSMLSFLNLSSELYRKEKLYIFEGEIDLMTAVQCGITNAISLPNGCGSLACIEQNKDALAEFQEIVLCLDDDAPGREARDKIVDMLTMTPCKLYKVYYQKKKDINEVLMKWGEEKVKEILTEKITLIQKGKKDIFIKDNIYYYRNGGNTVELTDFYIELTGFSDTYLIGYAINRGTGGQKDFRCSFSDLTTIKGITENLGLYFGNAGTIPLFLKYLKEENLNLYTKEIPYYGIHDNIFYDEDSNIFCDKYDLTFTSINSIDSLTMEEKRWLEDNIYRLRGESIQSLLGICWALGNLYFLDKTYPILEVSATTSAGKSEFIEFILRLTLSKKQNIKILDSLSEHQFKSLSSCSNTHAWAIDEVKFTAKNNSKENVSKLDGFIRAAYDRKKLNQGTTSNKLKDFYLVSPLIIGGETKIKDTSIRNRMIATKLNKNNKADYQIYLRYKNSDLLEKLGKLAIEYRLKNEKINQDFSALEKITDGRQKYNVNCLLTGLKLLTSILDIDNYIVERFVFYCENELIKEYSVVENFYQLLDLIIEDEYRASYIWLTKGDDCRARWVELYKAIAKYHKDTNSTLELLDSDTLKQQLVEEGILIDDKRVLSNGIKGDRKSYRTVLLKIENEKKQEILVSFYD